MGLVGSAFLSVHLLESSSVRQAARYFVLTNDRSLRVALLHVYLMLEANEARTRREEVAAKIEVFLLASG